MAHPNLVEPARFSLDEVLAEAKATAKDQLEAASQLQMNRLLEQLSSGWHSQVEHIFEERLAELNARVQEQFRSQLESELGQAVESGRREVLDRLNLSARRLREFETEEQWSGALVEATEGLCQRAALFVVNQQNLELRAARNLEQALSAVPLASAPAFAAVVESKDTVVAMRTAGELSEAIAHLVGVAPEQRSSLFPLATRDRVAAVLYADSGDRKVESSGLELIAAYGAAVIGGRQPERLHTILGAARTQPRPTTWFSLDKKDQDLHLRAQRFARVQVAEMRLYDSHAVQAGRANRDLYTKLKDKIDAGRQTFHRDFMAASDTMVDYFHLEMVRTLANDDGDLLGKDYPGPMV